MIFNYAMLSKDSLLPKLTFQLARQTKSVHFPSYWILALASTLHLPLSVVLVFAFHLRGKLLSVLSSNFTTPRCLVFTIGWYLLDMLFINKTAKILIILDENRNLRYPQVWAS